MNEATSLSLLQRAASTGDANSWERLAALYEPLMRRWIAQYEVQAADADDLIQEVFSVVAQELPRFDHSGQPGSFRRWLRKVLVHRLHNYWRTQKYQPRGKGTSSMLQQLHSLEDDNSDASRIWNAEHDQFVMSQLLQAVRPRFQAKTWEAFHRQMFDGERPDVVAAALGMSLSSVYVARNRVLSALRREAEGLVDSP